MPRVAVQESSRMSLRIRPEDKALLMRAVAYTQTDLTAFVLQNAIQAAKTIIAEAEQVALSERDSLRVLRALEEPPPPNARLLAVAHALPPLAMTVPLWHEEPIAKRHNRDAFDCGNAALNEFLRRYARQTHAQGGAKTFVAVPDDDTTRVLEFYALSPASVAYARTPEIIRCGLAHYDVPAFRLGRLAVDRSLQHQGLGGQLLLAAGRRCLRAAQEVGGVALLIDAKDDAVANWYASYGALRLLDAPLSLLLPLATVEAALEAAKKL